MSTGPPGVCTQEDATISSPAPADVPYGGEQRAEGHPTLWYHNVLFGKTLEIRNVPLSVRIPGLNSAHQKKGICRAIIKDVRTLGVYHRRSTHCRKRWEDLRRWSKKTAEAQLGMASQRGKGARRTMTPLMYRILAVAYPELDGCVRASQQPQGGEYTLLKLTLRALRGVWVVEVGCGFP
ncbi:hypothetical protein NDU88_000474 [Pleurodeles waltl]|uniref:Uncharacterized protein n=1 Tax=Pleurodeles waltl TaxID=8319 RepID=A0AAV7VTL3_PLEWA|nr:hypothetical protein NDU88_000474 [Pleurodeles waltl]